MCVCVPALLGPCSPSLPCLKLPQIPLFSLQHQQQVLGAIERAKQVTAPELNSIIRVRGARVRGLGVGAGFGALGFCVRAEAPRDGSSTCWDGLAGMGTLLGFAGGMGSCSIPQVVKRGFGLGQDLRQLLGVETPSAHGQGREGFNQVLGECRWPRPGLLGAGDLLLSLLRRLLQPEEAGLCLPPGAGCSVLWVESSCCNGFC